MKNKLYIVLIMTSFLFVSCDKKEVDIVPGLLYCVSTTEGDGFALFERKADDSWSAVYYLSEGRLMAKKRTVDLEIGKELVFVDDSDNEIPILSYSLYEEPPFKEYPETWTYRDSTYAVTVIENVVYGKAQGYWTSYSGIGETATDMYNAKSDELDQGMKELELTMDVYLPKDNREVSRPLLVLIHGGSFFVGDKTDLGFPAWARAFAGMGYVVASVNYRLGFKIGLDIASVKQAGFRGVQDVDAAIRYLIHHHDTYAVDPERVFVAGTSAGGITALNVAFMRDENIPSGVKDEGGIKSVNPEMTESYTVRAVGNMWGAVNDLSILGNASASVISFHSTGDPIVPFGKGHPFDNFLVLNRLLFPPMYGSGKITEYLESNRVALYSYDLPKTHTLHVDKDGRLNARFYDIKTAMCDFFSSVMIPSPVAVKHTDNLQTFYAHSSDIDSIFWRVEGGAILKQKDCSADLLLFPDKPNHTVLVCGKYKSGLSFRYKWNL